MRISVAGSPRVPAQGSSAQGEPAPKARAKAVADGNEVNIPQPAGGDGAQMWSGLIGLAWRLRASRKQPQHQTVPQTDTGGLVEHTQARERTVLKELGKLPP